MLVAFEVPGYVQPKQRTFGNRFVTPPETRRYEHLVGTLAKIAMKGREPFTTYVGVDVEVWCKVPASWSLKKKALALAGKIYPTAFDLDNAFKALADGMNEIVYVDDRFVSEIIARRKYACEEKAIVNVRALVPDASSGAGTSVSDR